MKPKPEWLEFGQKLKKLRKDAGVAQRTLAEQVGVNFTYLSKIENGIMAPPSEGTLARIAKAVDCDACDLIIAARKIPKDFAKMVFDSASAADFVKTACKTKPSAKAWKQAKEVIEKDK